ncbi:hypothetical protein [Mesorhizobium sp. M2C.T.Ca.TU.002.02.1.1]|uniref:hypothetical protein n=1 Tax=Mesorhizobium sp. M2C.T.Ca.TU.002.02.1.1 TaxID=2496788 RepID=UPI000FCB9479|nr:hypothetical protein [Mesorhizobium sp. M2C.T.Ca.TU.002.02.1.1]RUU53360.1 hypothetical protein EOD07_24390 [Mesorhizobium sp. M2C.T.Ca.TU.002.02.1.1]RUU55471.1 hypothetical protein EOD04_31865 [Mesorhizobium sp. M2C.T.Ca.TU.009.01.2.1]
MTVLELFYRDEAFSAILAKEPIQELLQWLAFQIFGLGIVKPQGKAIVTSIYPLRRRCAAGRGA